MGAAFIQLHFCIVERELCGRNESLNESATFLVDKQDKKNKEALTCQCSCLSS